MSKVRQPAYYIPHGAGPCFFMDWNPPDAWNNMAAFLKSISTQLPEQPKAILVISGHWLTPVFSVTSSPNPALIYDYYGFPEHTYELTYPANGNPVLSRKIVNLLSNSAITAEENEARGFDHGVFIPLKLMFPEADIPVVQMSLRRDLSPDAHILAGKALESLRDDGVLVVGSGMSYHNMRGYGNPAMTAPSVEFDRWLTHAVESEAPERHRLLSEWHLGPNAYLCHPKGHEEHLMPLMTVVGTAGNDIGRKVYSEKIMETQISAFRFG